MITDLQKKTLDSMKEKFGLKTDTKLQPKKKKMKGDLVDRRNPLSCKKKKKKCLDNNNESDGTKIKKPDSKVRKRKRIKLPTHVKEALFAHKNGNV